MAAVMMMPDQRFAVQDSGNLLKFDYACPSVCSTILSLLVVLRPFSIVGLVYTSETCAYIRFCLFAVPTGFMCIYSAGNFSHTRATAAKYQGVQ